MVLGKGTGSMGKDGSRVEGKPTFHVGTGGRGLWETGFPKFPQGKHEAPNF